MTKVTMQVQVGGFRNGERWPPRGSSIDVPAAEADQLVANGYAVKGADKVEKKTESAPEAAVPAAAKRPAKRSKG